MEEKVVTFNVAVFVPPGVRLTITLAKPVFVELFRSGTGPLDRTGVTDDVMFTLPANPRILLSVRLEVSKEPA